MMTSRTFALLEVYRCISELSDLEFQKAQYREMMSTPQPQIVDTTDEMFSITEGWSLMAGSVNLLVELGLSLTLSEELTRIRRRLIQLARQFEGDDVEELVCWPEWTNLCDRAKQVRPRLLEEFYLLERDGMSLGSMELNSHLLQHNEES